LVPPYLDDVQFGVNEGPMRVWFVRSIDLLQMLAVGVLIRESNWLAFDEAISTSSFGLVYRKVWNLRHSVLYISVSWRIPLADILSIDTKSCF
jgi:hypothetical protein